MRFPLAFLPSVIFATAKAAQVLTPEIDAFIEGVMSEWGSAGGVSIAIVQLGTNGEWNVETKGYGVARLSDNGPVTADTLFPIASNTKLFTAVSTGLLVSNTSLTPRLTYQTKLASIIPDWKLADPVASEEVTILDAMGHRTGLPRHDFMYRRDDTLAALTPRMRFLKPSTEIRDRFQYNNIMYDMLGYLPEIVSTKTPIARYVKENVFDRLGMTSTTYSFDVASKGDLSFGVSRENYTLEAGLPARGLPRQMPFWYSQNGGEDGNYCAGSGLVISNAKDIATWLQTLLLWGKNPKTKETVIPEAVLRRAASGISIVSDGLSSTPIVQSMLSPVLYGSGQETSSYRGHVIIEHGGDIFGSRSRIARLPYDNIGVAVFTNDEDTGGTFNDVIKYRLIDQALGLSPFDWNSLYKAGVQGVAGTSTPRPANASEPTIPGGLAALEATFNDPGYGNWSFCLFSPNNTNNDTNLRPPSSQCPSTQSPSSDFCRNLTANAHTILPGGINPNVPTLIAPVPAIWFDYVKLEHFDGNVFKVSGLLSYPTINDTSKPFWTKEVSEPGMIAEFGLENGKIGVGFRGGVWALGIEDGSPIPEPQGDTLKARSEIWMDRLGN